MQDGDGSSRNSTAIFEMAADALAGNELSADDAKPKIEGLLGMLGYRASNDASDPDSDTLNNRTSLLRAAARLGGIFRLHSRNAPGLTFFGGNAAPQAHARSSIGELSASLNGAGETPRQAFEACIGEGVEYLSQFRRADDGLRIGTFEDVAPWNDPGLAERLIGWMDQPAGKSVAIEWIAATRLLDGEPGWLPAALVLRDPDGALQHQQRFALSSGCAAGPSRAAAVTSALLEVVERDAVAMWWRGGRAGRPIALETLAGVNDLLGRIRQQTKGRATTLIDISGDFDIPSVAALSFDRDGSGFAGGFACRLNGERACKAAIIEMCQMELGNDVVAAKRLRLGADRLNEADRRQEQRKAGILPSQPHLIDGLAGTISLCNGRADSLPEVLARLARSGFHAYAVDLTRAELGIPVARVLIPGLQPYPSTFTCPRLAAALVAASHKSPYANGVDLF